MQKSLSEKRKLARGWFGEGGLPQGWQWIKLGNACEINPRRPKGFDRADDKPTTFIPMGAVNATCGMVDRPQTCPYREIKKGYTFFSDGDVLFAKITPCMQNGKHFIAGNSLDGVGFASTEFHVLRPGDSLLAEWVHFYLRQPAILKEATYHFTGTAGQQRVPDSFLKELSIPSPSLPEQKRIVVVLNKQMAAVEKARAAALERVEAVRALPSAWLREVFAFGGGGLPRGWRWEKLGDICSVLDNKRKPVKKADRKAGPYPYYGATGVLDYVDDYIFDETLVLIGEDGAKWGSGENTAFMASGKYWVNNHAHVVKPNENTLANEFLVHWLISLDLTPHISGSTVPKLNQEKLRSIPVPLPPLTDQKRLVSALNAKMAVTEKIRVAAEAELEAITALPAALLREAFSGAL